jgi:hypothetical protein
MVQPGRVMLVTPAARRCRAGTCRQQPEAPRAPPSALANAEARRCGHDRIDLGLARQGSDMLRHGTRKPSRPEALASPAGAAIRHAPSHRRPPLVVPSSTRSNPGAPLARLDHSLGHGDDDHLADQTPRGPARRQARRGSQAATRRAPTAPSERRAYAPLENPWTSLEH